MIGTDSDLRLPDDLSAFLTALQAKGITVGLVELIRLQQAFALEPELDRRCLRTLLACTLVKRPEQRDIFDYLFETWCPDESAGKGISEIKRPATGGTGISASRSHSTGGGTSTRRHSISPTDKGMKSPATLKPELWYVRLRRWLENVTRSPLVLVALCSLVVLLLLVRQMLGLAPEMDSFDVRLLFILSVSAIIISLLIWRQHQQISQLPPPAKSPVPGPDWLPLSKDPAHSLELLDVAALQSLVWGVGRFVSEDSTRRVDLRRTVAATARAAGIPEIHYRSAIYPREVWLWWDEQTEVPLIDHLIDQLVTRLRQAGLPVRWGVFADLPDQVQWDEGGDCNPLALDGHREGALVAILTDGAGLRRLAESAFDRGLVVNLLRSLAEWPRLTFVDLGRGSGGLPALAAEHGVRCIAPEELVDFLGAGERGGESAQRIRHRQRIDLQAWTAAAALAPHPIDEDLAYRLGRALDVAPSPWGYQALLGQSDISDQITGHDAPAPEERAQRLNWLAEAEERPGGRVEPDSLLGRALAFWAGCYQEERKRRTEQQGSQSLLPWLGTLAAQRLDLEEALLELWRDPSKATKALYSLFQEGTLAADIRERLADYAPQGHEAADGVVRLPWKFEDQPALTRLMLWRMGFSGERLPRVGRLQTPNSIRLAVAFALGMAAVIGFGAGGSVGLGLGVLASGTAVWLFRRMQPEPEPPSEPPELLEMVELPGGTFMMGSLDSDDQAYRDERPQHQVTVSAFAMGRYTVTRGLYREIVAEVPSEWKGDKDDDRLPANYMDWFDAVRFCNALSEKQGLQPCYRIDGKQVKCDWTADGYRLPTEAEWEYAIRAGTTTRWFCGNKDTELERYAWFNKNSESRVHSVGEKKPNPWGFHDLAGNVYEWCWDWYGDYLPEPAGDPTGPPSGAARVLRGGAVWRVAWSLRSARRDWGEPERRNSRIGFRCVRAPCRQHGPSSH